MNDIKTKLIDLLSGIGFSFKLLWKNERKLYFYTLFSTVINTVNSLIFIIFPKFLMDNLVNQKILMVFLTIIIFSTIQLLFNIINNLIDKRKNICSEHYKLLLKTFLVDKLASLRHEQMENTENLRRYEFAQKCIDNGNIEAYVQNVFSIISSIVVISGIIYILRNMPLWVLILIFCVTIINSIGNIISAKNNYAQITEETPIERNLYYLRGRLMNKEYAKEIRAFDLSSFIANKTKKAIEDFFNLFNNFTKKNNKILWWTHVIGGFQIIVLYAYNVLIFIRKDISVGTFTMNVTALFQFSDSLLKIFEQLIFMSEQSIYLLNYRDFLLYPSDYKGQLSIQKQSDYTIDFIDVSFKYPGKTQYALKNITTTIHAGEKVSIVGSNGAGKTTFIKLLLGLYKPTSGHILLNGKDIETLRPMNI